MKNSHVLLVLISSLVLASTGHAVVEENLKARPKADFTKVKQLEGDLDEVSIETEMKAAEASGHKGRKNEAVLEEESLKQDLQRLESQDAQLNTEIETTKKDAELAQAKVVQQKAKNAEARKRIVKSQKDRAQALAELAKVNAELSQAEVEEQALTNDNKFIQMQIGLLDENQETLRENIRRSEATLIAEKRRRQSIETNLARAKLRKKELDAKAERMQTRVEANAPHPPPAPSRPPASVPKR